MVPRLAGSATIGGLLTFWHTYSAKCCALCGTYNCHKPLPQLSLLVRQGGADGSTEMSVCERRESG